VAEGVSGLPDRRPDHRADAAQRTYTRVHLRNLVQEELADGTPVGRDGTLDRRALGVRRERENEHSAALFEGFVDHGPEAAEAQERACCDRVDVETARWIEVRLGVRGRRGTDVAALHVEQHKGSGGAELSDS
jgi:hypothetical protein